jgi:predicted nucleotide-binding protein
VQGKPFRWNESKIRIFEGPETREIPDFTSVLGPAAYEMSRVLTEVTDTFVTGPPGGTASENVPGNAVFVVHGSNVARREEVARFLLTVMSHETPVVVLHEQTNRGRTLLEKFETTAAQAQYAVVLLTGDDEARMRGSEAWEMRARQNVVFELGFLFGKLGRERVAVLYESGVERPSDIDGLVYIPFDEAGGWKLQIAREMRGVGLDVDLNRLGGDVIQ